ncbi:MAG: sigma-54 dependent transcriptional regulator [Cyclobacteriaceae bacterium]
MSKILVVDDEKSIRDALCDILSEESYEVVAAEDGADGFSKLCEEKIDLVLCDIKMPKMDGLELLQKASNEGFDVPFIMISAHGTIDTAVEATKKGAFDFIQKPPDLNRILLTVRNALDNSQLTKETKVLRKKVSKGNEIVGESEEITEVKEMIEKVAATEARVLITGENGTGKELVAKWLHEKSERSKASLVEVNCAAIPSELIESELFGHEKGSFTSAIKQRIGKFEQASGGTLFLDEIGDMSLAAQAKVLRALQDKKITRVGGDKSIDVNVRVLSATNKDLKKEIADGNFREDLYHRLSVMIIQVPALRERSEDITLLVDHFLDQVAEEYGAQRKEIDPDALKLLQGYEWTGNIRELRNVVERLVIMSNDTIKEGDVKKYVEV